MDEAESRPCGNKKCHEWIRSQGYDTEDHPDSVCAECGFSGPFYVYLSKEQKERKKRKQGT